ncbi:helix-turn-helix transcriptional regulator [Sphingomonas glaciei]|uniref:Helix-turn-helix transcriptional regulator n=1 Tax=Sphingomonas glaciei TaxID=2938948 RepID=A0ABY5MWR6_9SPHN|nr:AraC family transcriptional regulator [Sphingomonas glaciei]UUR08893.1 helix-turn-helix transcriptional regulator [Sphingomonas glaciei]
MMQVDPSSTIPRVIIESSQIPEAEQFSYWSAHIRCARLSQPVPGSFHSSGNMWNLGALQIILMEVDPFVAIRDRELVNAVDADFIQVAQLLEGTMTFETAGDACNLMPPACFVRDARRTSEISSTRARLLMLYFSRGFLEERTGSIDFQGVLADVPELALLREMACDLIRFFPQAREESAPLYAAILRDLTAAALVAAGATDVSAQSPLLASAKDYVATQPPGTLTVSGITAALGVSRSVIYRLFEREGGLLAYDRMRRLRALHRAMCNPLNTSTLAELAQRYGFRDQASLLRSFRKAFGYPPSELRRRHLSRTAPPISASASAQIQHAFDNID